MKTTATAVVWRRVLSVCLLCALWGEGTVRAVVKEAKEAIDAGGGAADAQMFFTGSVLGVWQTAEDALNVARDAAAGDDEGAKKTSAEVEKVAKTAELLHTAAYEVQTAVGEADRKTVKVLEGALNLTGNVPGVPLTQERVGEWKKKADEAADLWEKAAEKTEEQFSTTERMLKEVESAKEAAVNANKDGGAALVGEPKIKMEELEKRLTVLSESIQKAKDDAQNVTDLARKAKDKIKEAVNETVTQAMEIINNLVSVAKQETRKKSEDVKTPQPQNLPGGNENPTRNDGGGKTPTEDTKTLPHDLLGGVDSKIKSDNSGNAATGAPTPNELNKDLSLDGSHLTVFHLAATSVLLLLARVAAVVIFG